MTSDHTYTGGEHYWIVFNNGIHEVRLDEVEEIETVFVGNYAECLHYIHELIVENADYDLNL